MNYAHEKSNNEKTNSETYNNYILYNRRVNDS